MKRVRALSRTKYRILSFTYFLLFLSICLVCTKDEWRKRLCGMMMQPINATISLADPSGTLGTNIPLKSYPQSGSTVIKLMKKQTPIKETRTTKIYSMYFILENCISRISIESIMVMRTPAQKGIPNSMFNAIADPSTS